MKYLSIFLWKKDLKLWETNINIKKNYIVLVQINNIKEDRNLFNFNVLATKKTISPKYKMNN